LLILVDGKYSKEMIDLRSLNLLNLAGQLKAGKGLAITGAANCFAFLLYLHIPFVVCAHFQLPLCAVPAPGVWLKIVKKRMK
jgi:hypothetical protein